MELPDEDELGAGGVRVSMAGATLTVTLDRPEVRNAQTPAMWRALADIGRRLDPQVRVVVVRGRGPSFSAGLDRAMLDPAGIEGEDGFADLAALDDSALDAAIARFQEAFSWLRAPGLVSVAAVQGHAVGAGFQLALACDLRVVTDGALFCMRETALGLVPDLGGTKPLVDAVGYARALEMCATSRWVDAREALDAGLASIVVDEDALDGTVEDLASALTAPDHAAVTSLKGLLRDAGDRTYDEQLAAERAAQATRLRALVRRVSRA